jgi:hypothetical protein
VNSAHTWTLCEEAADERTRHIVAFLRTCAPYYADLVQAEFLDPEPVVTGAYAELEWDGDHWAAEHGATRGMSDD